MKKRKKNQRRPSGVAGRTGLTILALALVASAIIWLPTWISGSVRQALTTGVSSSSSKESTMDSSKSSPTPSSEQPNAVTTQTGSVSTAGGNPNTKATAGETSASGSLDGVNSTSIRMSETTRSTQTTATPKSTTDKGTTATSKAPTTAKRIDGLAGKTVVIDPGHQQKANPELEPVSPGSTILKAKCSAGTRGVVTGRYEYVVNLEISLKLKEMLEAQGCTVYMTRTSHDVNISNIERAQFAVAKKADVFLRIHCNGSADASAEGVKTYVGETGPFADRLPQWGRLLSACQSATTGAANLGVDVSSRYTGLNWAADVPSFLLEMGFMSNAEEDRLLSDAGYQDQICRGILDFIRQMPNL